MDLSELRGANKNMVNEILHLLLLHESLEEAEQLISVLRNAGIAVRPSRAEDLEDVQEIVEDKPVDILFYQEDNPEVALEPLVRFFQSSNRDTPVIVVQREANLEKHIHALRHGAQAVVVQGGEEHLVLIARREMENLRCRRQVRRLETAYRESEKRNHALLDSSKDAIAYVHEGAHVFANRAYLDMFQFQDLDEIDGLPILEMIAQKDQAGFKKILRKLTKNEIPPDGQNYQAQRANGEQFEVHMEFSTATIEGEPCTQIVLREAAFNPEMEQELNQLRMEDLLTGLQNRQYFTDRLDQSIKLAQDGNMDQFLLYIELENFKGLSDQVGLSGTDLLLRDVGDLLKSILGEELSLARFRDQIFTCLMKGPQAEVEKKAELVRSSVEDHISDVGKQSVSMTSCIGVVAIGEGAISSESLLTQAGEACAEGLKKGGNRVQIYSPKLSSSEEDGMHWVHLIKNALSNDSFHLLYQQVVSLHGGEGDYFEILLRMEGPKGEDISPGYFMGWAEKHGLMPAIDRWVIRHVIEQLKEREEAGIRTTFFVKISTETLSEASTLPWLAKELKAARVRGDGLVFELPESKVITHMKPARQFHRGLKQLHCCMALEQFGLGLNSFQILKHLPAEYLKIDRSLMEAYVNNPENQAKVKEIADKAHSAGKLAMAEFVEDAASMSILWQQGVNFVAGNFIKEPDTVMSME